MVMVGVLTTRMGAGNDLTFKSTDEVPGEWQVVALEEVAAHLALLRVAQLARRHADRLI